MNRVSLQFRQILRLATAQGGIAIHDSKFDLYSATLKCHDANGEIYYVVFTRDYVMLADYSDDSITDQVRNLGEHRCVTNAS